MIAEYSRTFRLVEISAIALFAALFAALAARGLSAPLSVSSARVVLIVLAGALAADLVSGLVHWAADTWGDQTWPIVGPTLIRSFREHHVDEKAITRHDFIEANGATALVLLPMMIGANVFLPGGATALFVLSLGFFVFMTNQFHKWAHVDRAPWLVRVLQRLRLILTVEHHRVHHTGRHTAHYCITTGWFNPVLDRLQFFRFSERAIEAVSTLQAREDDLKLIE